MVILKSSIFISGRQCVMNEISALHEQLREQAQVTWYAGEFGQDAFNRESMGEDLDQVEYAIFVFSPDDVAECNGEQWLKVQDNGLSELGLHCAKARKGQVVFVLPHTCPFVSEEEGKGYSRLTDFEGFHLLSYQTGAKDVTAATSGAAHDIQQIVGNKAAGMLIGK